MQLSQLQSVGHCKLVQLMATFGSNVFKHILYCQLWSWSSSMHVTGKLQLEYETIKMAMVKLL